MVARRLGVGNQVFVLGNFDHFTPVLPVSTAPGAVSGARSSAIRTAPETWVRTRNAKFRLA